MLASPFFKIAYGVVGALLILGVSANVLKNLIIKQNVQQKVDPYANIPRITINQIEHLGEQYREPSYLLEVRFLGISKLSTDLLYGTDSQLMHITVQDKQETIFSNVSLSKERDGRRLADMAYGKKIKIIGKVFKLYTQFNTVEYIFTGILVD